MAFHPERLTGRRKRQWDRSVSWASRLDTADRKVVPATVMAKLKRPQYLQGLFKVRSHDPQSAKGYHWVAVVRGRVVLLDHVDEATEKSLRAWFLGAERGCRCHDVRDMWGTFTWVDHRSKWQKSDNPQVTGPNGKAWMRAHKPGDLHEDMVTLRSRCRRPAGQYRGRISGAYDDVLMTTPEAEHPEPAAYPKDHGKRWAAFGLTKRLVGLAARTAADELRRRKGYTTKGVWRLLFAHAKELKVTRTRRSAADPVEVRVAFHSYTWYSRLWARGVRLLGGGEFMPLHAVWLSPTAAACEALDLGRLADFAAERRPWPNIDAYGSRPLETQLVRFGVVEHCGGDWVFRPMPDPALRMGVPHLLSIHQDNEPEEES